MRVLLVNDDSYGEKGIVELEKILSQFVEVFVVAPKYPQSARSSSFTSHIRNLPYEVIDEHHIRVDATPVDCVNFAVSYFSFPFDIVFSGCNDGWNIAYDIFYSGTIGACIQANVLGIPSVAFSSFDGHFDSFIRYGKEFIEFLLHKKTYSSDYILNVNFPRVMVEPMRIAITSPFQRKSTYHGDFTNMEGKLYRINNDEECYDEEDDLKALNDGKISVSYLNLSWNSQTLKEKHKKEW